MQKKLLQELKQKLEETKTSITEELQSFAERDPNLKGDWDTRFPKHDGGSGGQILEDAADEVEEYITRLPLEHGLEIKLRDVELALEKIKKGGYGKCEKCKKLIPLERLKIQPEARFCLECQKK